MLQEELAAFFTIKYNGSYKFFADALHMCQGQEIPSIPASLCLYHES